MITMSLLIVAVHQDMILTCILVDTGILALHFLINFLMYKLWYKKKRKFSIKEYILSSVYGIMFCLAMIVQLNLMK